MRKLNSLLPIILSLLFVAIACSEKNDPIIEISEEIKEHKYVNEWIYKKMVKSYFWNDDIPKRPDFTLKPDLFFESILSQKDRSRKGYRFSWIEENYDDLLGSLSSVQSDEIGFEYIRITYKDSNKEDLLVLYPKVGSDAFAKEINRGRFITAIDSKEITSNNYKELLSGTGSKTLTMADWVFDNDKYVFKDSGDVTIRMEKDFKESPVYLDSVYTFGGKEIGYLVYNSFVTGKTDNSHEYDQLLMESLSRIKAKGATEMILDLRYNGGGRVTTAIALASALVKNRSTKDVLVTAEYNKLEQSLLEKKHNADYFNDYFIDKIKDGNSEIVVPSLKIQKLYILVTEASASASELIINGLKPYMDVILIGQKTYGKNVGSWSIYEKDDPKNKWGMQPITVKYYNSKGESDFTDGFTPDFIVDEFRALNFRLVEFGNTEDPLLSVALNHITGNEMQTRSMMKRDIPMQFQMIEVENSNSIFKDKSRFEMYDDVRGERIRKLMNN